MNYFDQTVNVFFLTRTVLASPMAYIDPNTGGMLFQMLAVILALFSGVIFFFSRQIKSSFAKIRRKMRGEAEPIEAETAVVEPEEKTYPDKEG